MRVVIVDDSVKIRAELRQIITRQGWEVVGEGDSGIDALELVKNLKPDLLTLDIIMPEMDGIECYRKLRALGTTTRCLLISVLASEPRVIQAFEREIYPSHFLRKPVNERDFKEKVEELFKQEPLCMPYRLEGDQGGTELPPVSPS